MALMRAVQYLLLKLLLQANKLLEVIFMLLLQPAAGEL
jgi:hypothetical protein